MLLPATAAAQDPPVRARHVVIISIDGLRHDVLLRADATNVRRLIDTGSYTFWARTVPECYTLPAHVSMLTGVPPEKHGVTWNDHIEEAYPLVPTVFEVAKRSGLTTALVSGKTKFVVFDKPGTLDWKFLPRDEPVPDTFVGGVGATIIRRHRPNVLFVHLAGVDAVGHEFGWGTPAQLAAVAEADKAVGLVLAALEETKLREATLVLLTADHGGAGREHGPDDARSQYVPWVANGPGVRRNYDLTRNVELKVSVLDTFATACGALGLRPPAGVEGRFVADISAAPRELLRDKPR